MKLSKLTDPVFQSVLNKLVSKNIPLKTAFKLKNMVKKVNESISTYESIRIEAVNRYGEKNDKGELILDEAKSASFSKENGEIFNKELNTLLKEDVDVGSISVSELGDNLSVSTADLLILDGMITD